MGENLNYIRLFSYILSVTSGHVIPNLPYISDTATYPPESCYFAQLINIGSMFLGLFLFVRYQQILKIYESHPDLNRLGLIYNKMSLWFGTISCVGVNIVANFQETNVRYAHYFGALSCFGFGTLYFWIHALISYMVLPIAGTKLHAHFRVLMAVGCTIFFIAQSVTGLLSYAYYADANPRKWYPADGGWGYHIASTISEWVVAYLFCFYVLSFTEEFRSIEFVYPQIRIKPRSEENIV